MTRLQAPQAGKTQPAHLVGQRRNKRRNISKLHSIFGLSYAPFDISQTTGEKVVATATDRSKTTLSVSRFQAGWPWLKTGGDRLELDVLYKMLMFNALHVLASVSNQSLPP